MSRSVTGVAAAAATLWTATELSPSTGSTCPIPLAFAAAHPLARLATEKSIAGCRACGVLVWHRPRYASTADASTLSSACSAHPLSRPLSANGALAEQSNGNNAHSACCRSGDQRNSSRSPLASSLSSRTDPGPVGPPPALCVRRDAVFTSQVAQRRDLHGENSSLRETDEEMMLLSPRRIQASRVPTCILVPPTAKRQLGG